MFTAFNPDLTRSVVASVDTYALKGFPVKRENERWPQLELVVSTTLFSIDGFLCSGLTKIELAETIRCLRLSALNWVSN